ncbi:hypothetical protein ACFLKB_07670 [Clostridium sp. FAM 1755]|uniref:Uncharacterized protein n=1 Tax=Clostridium sporogenes TaxID=1509 RepID=A0AAE4JV84_CLOSG|nr:hypothetical protein [Clostridium sporogenes]MDS1005093.1 hypothetical protein [Clostridium sporogenes]
MEKNKKGIIENISTQMAEVMTNMAKKVVENSIQSEIDFREKNQN